MTSLRKVRMVCDWYSCENVRSIKSRRRVAKVNLVNTELKPIEAFIKV